MVCLVGYGLSGGLSVGCGVGCMGLHSVGCSGWYIDAFAYLSGLCSGFESCVSLWVCSFEGIKYSAERTMTCSLRVHICCHLLSTISIAKNTHYRIGAISNE
jgi:hypothetical protein